MKSDVNITISGSFRYNGLITSAQQVAAQKKRESHSKPEQHKQYLKSHKSQPQKLFWA